MVSTHTASKKTIPVGQIPLVRQITAQITKPNLWEISVTRVDIMSFDVPAMIITLFHIFPLCF